MRRREAHALSAFFRRHDVGDIRGRATEILPPVVPASTREKLQQADRQNRAGGDEEMGGEKQAIAHEGCRIGEAIRTGRRPRRGRTICRGMGAKRNWKREYAGPSSVRKKTLVMPRSARSTAGWAGKCQSPPDQ